MGVKVRHVRERWIKRNGIPEKVKLEKPYWAVYVDYKGQRKFLKVEGGKEKAIAKARDIEDGLFRDEWNNPEEDPAAVLFEDYAKGWLAGKKATRAPGTADSYRGMLANHILPYFGTKSLRDITKADIREFAGRKVADGYSPGAVKLILAILRAILSQAVDEDILSVNVSAKPGKHIPKESKKKPNVWKPEDTETLLKAAREKDPDIYPALLLGFRGGLRIGEICALAWNDIDFDKGIITVRQGVNKGRIGPPKGGGERSFNMSPELDTALRSHRGRTAEKTLRTGARWIYPGRDGKPVGDDWIRRRFSKCVEAAGFPASGKFHSARRSCTSHLLESGAPLPFVRDFLGHADITTTNRYSHSLSDAHTIVGRLDTLGKSANPRKQKEGVEGKAQET